MLGVFNRIIFRHSIMTYVLQRLRNIIRRAMSKLLLAFKLHLPDFTILLVAGLNQISKTNLYLSHILYVCCLLPLTTDPTIYHMFDFPLSILMPCGTLFVGCSCHIYGLCKIAWLEVSKWF